MEVRGTLAVGLGRGGGGRGACGEAQEGLARPRAGRQAMFYRLDPSEKEKKKVSSPKKPMCT
jgi:hypothetical protein